MNGANNNAKKPGKARAGDKMAPSHLPPGERDERNKILSNQQIVEKILSLQKMALENAQFYLQLTYCDTTFCHRFVHFEVDIDYIEQFEPILNEYIDTMKTIENDGILHYHLQEMPNQKQLAQMDPHHNPLLAGQKQKRAKRSKAKKEKDMLVKDLFGDIVDPANQDDMDENESESDEDEFGG